MAKLLQPVTACLKKGKLTEKEDSVTMDKESENDNSNAVVSRNTSLLWGVSSRLYSMGTGAVGLGVQGVKWAASTTYTVGSGVVATAQTVGSGVVSTAQTVGSGVVSTAQTVGSGVVSTAQTVVGKVVPSVCPKPKKE